MIELMNWGFDLPTEIEQRYAMAAYGSAYLISDAQKMGETPRGRYYPGGAHSLLTATREMVEYVGRVVS